MPSLCDHKKPLEGLRVKGLESGIGFEDRIGEGWGYVRLSVGGYSSGLRLV